jgi:uncharacterized protein (DUF1499 family)
MKLATIALAIALTGAALLVIAGPGTRLGFWTFGTGFLLMRWGFFTGLAAAASALVLLAIPHTRRTAPLMLSAALLIGLITAWVPWNGYRTVQSLPFIHDITTDTGNPPPFVAIAPLRADAPNPLAYPGEETAAQQRAAYPDITTLEFARPPTEVFEQALEAARNQGWEIIAAVPEEGRIEATATTLWFGFKDDVVIRIVPVTGGTRLDMRSKSRVGRSDVGANAERIRRFTRELERSL